MALRTTKHTNHDLFRTVTLAVAALVMLSCQQEDNLDNGQVTIYPVLSRSVETTVQTRALAGYSEFTVDKQPLSANAIAFNAQNDARVAAQDKQGIFAPLTGGWRSTVQVEPSYKYNLYAYSRNMPTATAPTFVFGTAQDVSLTFNGLDIITEIDPLVGVAAAGKSLPANNVAPNNYPELTKGVFSLGTIPAADQQGSTFKAFMALDHLYSKATISFRVDEEYSNLRVVHIKDVQIKIDKGTLTGNHTYTFYDQKLQFADNKVTGGSALSIDLYDGPNATATPNGNEDFIALTTQFREFGHYYFLPLNPTPSMYLEVTYDIYDLKGNPVRENQIAKNSNIFASINHNGGRAQSGKNYLVKILVSPTYLYQLSDADLELGLTVEQQ